MPPALYIRPSLRRAACLAALVASVASVLAGCGSAQSSAPTLLDAIDPGAAAVVRVSGEGLASAGDLLPTGGAALLTLLPRERIVEIVAATDTSGAASAVVVRVTGSASDFTGFLGATGATHRGAALFTVPGTGASLAAKGDLLVVDPDAARVRATLDRLAGQAPRLSRDRVAIRLYRRTEASPIGVVTGAGQTGALLGGAGAGGLGDVLSLVPLDRAALGLRLSGAGADAVATGTLWLAPREGTPAASLASLLGLASAALGQQSGLPASTRALLATLRFTVDGGDVATPLTVPVSLLVGAATGGGAGRAGGVPTR